MWAFTKSASGSRLSRAICHEASNTVTLPRLSASHLVSTSPFTRSLRDIVATFARGEKGCEGYSESQIESKTALGKSPGEDWMIMEEKGA